MTDTSSAAPNILLICVDQWRGDCLSVEGHPAVLTPYLDGWSSTGARFTRAYSAVPTCIPARAALFTGLSQRTHGFVGYREGVPWDFDVTLAGELTRAGYQSQAIGKMHVYPERAKIGFEDVLLHDGYLRRPRGENLDDLSRIDDYVPWLRERSRPEADYAEHGVNCNSYVARPWDKPEHLHPTNWAVAQGVEFLQRRDKSRPFFLYLSLHRPHPPYDPPAWAMDLYLNDDLPKPPVGDWADLWAEREAPNNPRSAYVANLDRRLQSRAQAGYYGHMSHIDTQLNRLFETMAELGLNKSTYILFTSDHGELMGDHNLFGKSLPYEGSARIPFVLTGPGIPAGGMHDDVIELRDVMPTLLEIAGLPVPAGVEGRSVLSILDGTDGEWRKWLHGEHVTFGQSVQWMTDGREKYIWCSGTGTEQLFDLVADPQECHNLARLGTHTSAIQRWRARLIRELRGRPEGFIMDNDLVAGRIVSSRLTVANTAAVLNHRREVND